MAHEYDASQIQVLEGLEAVRKRPGMYIGTTSSQGLHHLVWEIVDNGIDEALAGFATKITVTVEKDNSITVTDDGRGIPVDIQKKTGKPALETVLPSCMPAVNLAAADTRSLVDCMVLGLQSLMRCPQNLMLKSPGTEKSITWTLPAAMFIPR